MRLSFRYFTRFLTKMSLPARSDVWLYAHPSMDRLATTLVERCKEEGLPVSEESGKMPTFRRRTCIYMLQDQHQASTKSTDSSRNVDYKRDGIQWNKFRDGFPNLFIEDVKHMAGKDVIFLASFHSPEVVFEQISVIYAIPRYLARSFTVILPYFPTGTMERVDTEGQIATAKTLAHLLSSIALTARGPAQIIMFDIHALQERFYFNDSVIPRLESAIPLLQRELKALAEDEKICIAFPDDGAFKRFHSMFPQSQTIICTKIRDGNKRIVKVKDGDPEGYHVVIVDDLVQTGGTLKECCKALLAQGAKKVSAYVTHPVFPQDSWKSFTEDEPKFENFWITDSLPHAYEIAQNRPFKLLSLCDVIGDVLLGFDLLQ